MINYEYYNANPKNKKTTDCVVRALVVATGKSYETVLRELVELSLQTGWFIAEKRLEDRFLELNGFIKHKQPRKWYDGSKYDIGEIDELEDCLDKIVIIRCTHHLTVVKDFTLYDIWDCRGRTILNYYTKQR